MSAVAAKYPELQKLGVEVISVSVDSHFVHKMWNDHELTKMVEGGVPFHMASDQAGNVGRAWLYVEPDGDVLPAQGEADKVMGNMLTDAWEKIYRYHGAGA